MVKRLIPMIILLTIVIQSRATVQIHDRLIIDRDTLPLISCPLESYLSQRNMIFTDIPGLENTMASTGLWRGYRATWKIVRNKLYLVELTGPGSQQVNLGKMFGKSEPNSMIHTAWVSQKLVAQWGEIVYHDSFIGRVLSMEKVFAVEKGVIKSMRNYPTLTGDNAPDMIRIWDGKKVDPDQAIEALQQTVIRKFRWTDMMDRDREITVTLRIGDDFSNTIQTGKQHLLQMFLESLTRLKRENAALVDKRKLTQKEEERLSAIEKEISTFEQQIIPRHRKQVEQERQCGGVYLDELVQILQPIKVETLLYNGLPYLSIFTMTFHFDSKNKVVTARKYDPFKSKF